MKASATSNSESSASPAIQTPSAPRLPRIGPASATWASCQAFVRHLLHPDDRAEEGDEERRRGRHALPAELDDVAQLVDEEEEHEPDGEAPAPDPGVGRDRDEHRRGRGEELELEEREERRLELEEQDPTAAIGAHSFRPSSRQRPCGWIGS